MRADWTRPDQAITAYIQSFGRYGIPVNVVYGPGRPDGELLPELLSTELVVKALDHAAGPGVAAR
jgi:suppressor for copper-sensitivity B